MSHPRIEEVQDSDDDASDPSEGDIDDFDDADILRRVDEPQQALSKASPSPSAAAAAAARAHLINPAHIPSTAASRAPIQATADASKWAGFQALYPVYFDATRTRAQGRRVAKHLAVRSPLAREMVNACAALGLPTLFEPTKMHPKDWANPGRVKVALGGAGGGSGSAAAKVANKHHLYRLVAQHLAAHPVAEDSAVLREPVQGAPPPPARDRPYPRPAVPRGWKMGEFLPYYSPAMTGGGVSENLIKDMMKEMQGGGGGGDMASMLQAAAAGGAGEGGRAGVSGVVVVVVRAVGRRGKGGRGRVEERGGLVAGSVC